MAVTIVSNEDKVEMLYCFTQHEDTLTSIGEDFGVSRKTVRRCIDEVNKFLAGIQVGDTINLKTDEGLLEVTVALEDKELEDTMPVAVRFPDGVVDYVELHQLMDGEQMNEVAERVTEEVEASEIVETVANKGLSVGDSVRIRKDSHFYGDGYGNPIDQVGTVASIENGVILPILVRWEEDGLNSYDESDLYVVEPEPEVEEVTENAQYFVTAPQDSLTIVRIDQDTGEVSQRQTNKHNENFGNLRDMIKADQSQECLKVVYEALDTTRMLESYSVGRVKVNPQTESVVFVRQDGSERAVPDDIAMDIITTVREYGRDSGEKLVKFLDKLMTNVSFKAIEGLYRFMKHNCIEINDDGSIQAWKGVAEDLHSISSGKIANSPTCPVRADGRIDNSGFGTEIRVDRSEVDDDPDATCSHGLHVGNRSYAESFGRTLLSVKVEPQDVVAVPKDYNGAKMRCCAYTPLFAV
ncbi:MAG: putative protein rIIB [Prokaryotic dsDNA virus sp.]|jgi:hypothetical protein|nr:MAG: putative protein rIIB [Prokaryotic dsDNA virus sp.]|tara:strand:- start:38336 stop:39736 length:1401 start_codon:yes stop_codon:yes gene_type:complete